jgi:hypothetical protein
MPSLWEINGWSNFCLQILISAKWR